MALYGHGQSTFNKYFPVGSYSRPSDIILNKDSSYTLLAAYVSSGNGSDGLTLTKFGKLGNILLQKNHFSNTPEGYYTFGKNKQWIGVSAYSYLLLAACGNNSNTTGVLLAKINAQTLDTIWVKRYADPPFDLPTRHIIKIAANRYWLIGNKFDNNNTSYIERPVIYETDTLGNIYFRKEFGNFQGFIPDAITYDPTQTRIYMAGLNYTVPIVPQSFVACVDTNGIIDWNQQIGVNPYITHFYQIEKKNNYLVLSGSKYNSYNGNFSLDKLCLTKLNAGTGNLTWQKTYGAQGLTTGLKGMVIDNDESIAASGNYEITNPYGVPIDRYGIIFKASSSGDSLWLKGYSNYPGIIVEDFLDLKTSFDGGYITSGLPWDASTPNSQSWVVKTDSLGNAPGVYTQVVNIRENGSLAEGITFYPNPATTQITIQYTEALSVGSLHIFIYSSLGQLVREEMLYAENGKFTLETSNLEAGIYELLLCPTQLDKNAGFNPIRKQFIIGQ